MILKDKERVRLFVFFFWNRKSMRDIFVQSITFKFFSNSADTMNGDFYDFV